MRALIIETYSLTGAGAKWLLRNLDSGMRIDEAITLSQARQLLRAYSYDIVILDTAISRSGDGSERDEEVLLNAVVEDAGESAIVVLSDSPNPDALKRAIDAGAATLIPKTSTLTHYEDVFRRLLGLGEKRGQANCAPPDSDGSEEDSSGHAPNGGDAPPDDKTDTLSPRQRAVLPLLAEGKSNKEIARILHLQENTVKLHVRQILRRLDVRNRTEAAIAAHRVINGGEARAVRMAVIAQRH